MMGYVSDELVTIVERTGSEAAVTLSVNGTVLAGYLTPMARYSRVMSEVVNRTVLEGGQDGISGTIGPIPEADAEAARQQWAERGIESDVASFNMFAMRDVTVRSGAAPNWFDLPIILVQSASVGFIALGTPNG